MASSHDQLFYQDRCAAFDKVIARVDDRIQSIAPKLLAGCDTLSPAHISAGAEKEVWSLFLQGVRHLKDGAPGHQPGSITEALSRTSLRASAFAAALGVRRPHFEQLYFSVDYTSGHEAALFYCQRLAEAAEGDVSKSRQIIQQKILVEKPADAELKKHMALAFDALVENYMQCCRDFKTSVIQR